MAISTNNTNFFLCSISVKRAIPHTCVVVAKGKTRTIRALGAKEEYILKGKVCCVGSTLIKIKVKFAASPNCEELQILLLVVDDKSSYSMDSGIISSNVLIWCVAYIYTRRLFIYVNSVDDA